MKTTLEPLSQPYLLRVVEDDENFLQQQMDFIWNKKSPTLNVSGFKQGTAPRDIAEKNIGLSTLYEELVELLVSRAVEQCFYDKQISIVEIQQAVVESLTKKVAVLQVVAILKPTIELDYTKIKVSKPTSEVTEEAFEKAVKNLCIENHKDTVVERGLQLGDILTLSFIGYLNGKTFDGGSVTNFTLQFEPNRFITDFQNQIIGMKAGENKSITVKFPEDYDAKHLAGEVAEFDVVIHDIKERYIPSYDEQLATTLGYENLEALTLSVKETLKNHLEQSQQAELEKTLMSQLLDNSKFSPIPQVLVDNYLERMISQLCNEHGVSEPQLLEKIKLTKEQFKNQQYYIALRDVKAQLILDHVAEKLSIVVNEADRQAYIESEAERLKMSTSELSKMVTNDQIDARVRMRKAYDHLLQECVG